MAANKTSFKKGHLGFWEGKHRSEKTKQKISESEMGHPSYTKGKTGIHSKEGLQRMAEASRNRIWTDESREKLCKAQTGKNNSMYGRRAELNPNWKGGISSLYDEIRHSQEYSSWRLAVLRRDNFTCQRCGIKSINLEAHHIIKIREIMDQEDISNFEEAQLCGELWDIDNGVTLCKKCHLERHREELINEKVCN